MLQINLCRDEIVGIHVGRIVHEGGKRREHADDGAGYQLFEQVAQAQATQGVGIDDGDFGGRHHKRGRIMLSAAKYAIFMGNGKSACPKTPSCRRNVSGPVLCGATILVTVLGKCCDRPFWKGRLLTCYERASNLLRACFQPVGSLLLTCYGWTGNPSPFRRLQNGWINGACREENIVSHRGSVY